MWKVLCRAALATPFSWELAAQAKPYGPVILAGGLTPENVETAIEQTRPYGVDVSTGVESAPGIKDHRKVREFIARAKAVGDWRKGISWLPNSPITLTTAPMEAVTRQAWAFWTLRRQICAGDAHVPPRGAGAGLSRGDEQTQLSSRNCRPI